MTGCRAMKDYKETDWSAMSEVQKDLEQLEAKVAQEFGEKCKLEDCKYKVEVSVCAYSMVRLISQK